MPKTPQITQTVTFEKWLQSDELACVAVDRDGGIVYILPYDGENDQIWICVNATTERVWTSNTRMLQFMFKETVVRPVTIE